MDETRRKAFITELSSLRPQGTLIFSDEASDQAKSAWTAFVAGVRKTLDYATKECATLDVLSLLTTNPESFFNTASLIRNLQKAGYTDPKVMASLIAFDDSIGKAVIVDPKHPICIDRGINR